MTRRFRPLLRWIVLGVVALPVLLFVVGGLATLGLPGGVLMIGLALLPIGLGALIVGRARWIFIPSRKIAAAVSATGLVLVILGAATAPHIEPSAPKAGTALPPTSQLPEPQPRPSPGTGSRSRSRSRSRPGSCARPGSCSRARAGFLFPSRPFLCPLLLLRRLLRRLLLLPLPRRLPRLRLRLLRPPPRPTTPIARRRERLAWHHCSLASRVTALALTEIRTESPASEAAPPTSRPGRCGASGEESAGRGLPHAE